MLSFGGVSQFISDFCFLCGKNYHMVLKENGPSVSFGSKFLSRWIFRTHNPIASSSNDLSSYLVGSGLRRVEQRAMLYWPSRQKRSTASADQREIPTKTTKIGISVLESGPEVFIGEITLDV